MSVDDWVGNSLLHMLFTSTYSPREIGAPASTHVLSLELPRQGFGFIVPQGTNQDGHELGGLQHHGRS